MVFNVIVSKDAYRYAQGNVYQATNTGTTGSSLPTHKDGVVLNGEVNFKHIGFRVNQILMIFNFLRLEKQVHFQDLSHLYLVTDQTRLQLQNTYLT